MDDSLNVMPRQIRYFRPTQGEATAEQIHECPQCGGALGVSSLQKEPRTHT